MPRHIPLMNQNQNCYWWHVKTTFIHQDVNDEAELQEHPRADDIDEEERDNPPDREKIK